MLPRYDTDFRRLAECVARVAEAMGVRGLDPRDAEACVRTLVVAPPSEGGKEILACLCDGLITEVEARDLLMANVATWVAHEHGLREPTSATWTSRDLTLEFELALLGRPARG
jgi:hypothetical protein